MTKTKIYTVKIEGSCKDGCGNEVPDITEGALRRELCKSFPDFSITVDEVLTRMKPEDVVPVSKQLQKDENHVALICKAFMWDKTWYDGTNPYAGRSRVYEKTVPNTDGKETTVYSFSNVRGNPKKLFEPTDAEIQAALDEFKKKGWHAQYDSEVGCYVVFEGTRAVGEHSARYTRNLF